MNNLYLLTAHQLLDQLRTKSVSSEEIVESVYERAGSVDKKVKAYVVLERERAIKQAKESSLNKSDGKLKGIPVAVKDNICVEGELTTCASKILKGFRPPYNATVIDRLLNAGAVLMGKTNMDEFAFGSSCESSSYYPTLNPWDLERIPWV